jgi:hypothetical protein
MLELLALLNQVVGSELEIKDNTFSGLKDVIPGEEVVGKLPKELRPFWYLSPVDSCGAQVVETWLRSSQMKPSCKVKDGMSTDFETHQVKLQMDFLHLFFWKSVRMKFPQTFGCRYIGIRKGWKVVVFD